MKRVLRVLRVLCVLRALRVPEADWRPVTGPPGAELELPRSVVSPLVFKEPTAKTGFFFLAERASSL